MATFPKNHNGGPSLGHNGGPPLDPKTPSSSIILGEKFMQLFGEYRHMALFGGRGSGKSHAVAIFLVTVAAKSKLRIVCARQFQNSIRDSVKELIENYIIEMGLSNQYTVLEREIIHNVTGSRFTFIGLDRNPDSAKSLEGADICFVEEARTINARSMEILIPTIRKPGSKIIWAWNPEHPTDPVDAYFRGGRPPPNSVVCQVGIEDNPFFYHTPLADEMEHMRIGNPQRYKHVWLGAYDENSETKIFSNVIIGKVINIGEHIPARYGMDFGFGSDPSFITKAFVLHEQKIIYVERSACGRVPLRDLPAMMDSVIDSRSDLIIGDSSQPGTIEHLCSQGFRVIGAKKGPGSVKAGINWLQGYKIVIHPSNEEHREEARLYSWQVDRITKQILSVPVDANNHGWDALRYATESAQIEAQDDKDGGVIKVNFRRRR